MSAEMSTVATFAAAGAALALPIGIAFGFAFGRADRRHARRAESAAVAGYGRATVTPPPVDNSYGMEPYPGDDAVHFDLDDTGGVHVDNDQAEDFSPGWWSRTHAIVEETWATWRGNRHTGWDTPDTFADLQSLSGGRHAAREVTP